MRRLAQNLIAQLVMRKLAMLKRDLLVDVSQLAVRSDAQVLLGVTWPTDLSFLGLAFFSR